MKWTVLISSVLLVSAIATGGADASRRWHCHEWAREQVRRQPTPARGAVRGAAVGAIGGAILGRPGIGAAAGAGVGAAHSAGRRNRTYDYYFDRCMRHWR